MSYANIRTFGQDNQPPCSGSSDPLTYCLVDTMDRNFQHAPVGNLYGPRSQKCQQYMAERCAEKWDGFCEYYYVANNPMSGWPNNQAWPNTVMPRAWVGDLGSPLSTGEQLLQNTAEIKYCTYENCIPRHEIFDPMNPNSPTLTYYNDPNGYGMNCIPICNKLNVSELDTDPVMQRMLANPKAAAPTLVNICNTAEREGINLSGTQLGGFCQRYKENLSRIN